MDRDTFSQWLKEFGNAWILKDENKASELFSEDAIYHENPFADPIIGRDAIRWYWRSSVEMQEDINFEYDVLTADDNMGIAQWWASFTRIPSKAFVRLDGIAVVTIDKRGLCKTFHEWSHVQEIADETDS